MPGRNGGTKTQGKFGGAGKRQIVSAPSSYGRNSKYAKGKSGHKISATEIKAAMLKQSEQKIKVMRSTWSPSEANTHFATHNVPFGIYSNLYAAIHQGMNPQDRTGDDIYVNRIRMRFMISDDYSQHANTRGPGKLRILTYSGNKSMVHDGFIPLIGSTDTLNATGGTTANGGSAGVASNYYNASVNTDAVKLMDETYIGADKNCGFTRQFEINIPVNKKISYASLHQNPSVAAFDIYGANNVTCMMVPYLDIGDWGSMGDGVFNNMEVEVSVFFKDYD